MLCCGPDLPLSCNEMVLRNVQEVGEEESGQDGRGSPAPGSA